MTLANNIGIIPLHISPTKVRSAAFFPYRRITLVVPGLPEPPVRGSDKPSVLQTIIAAETDPRRYAEKINKILINIDILKSLSSLRSTNHLNIYINNTFIYGYYFS